MGVHGVSFIDLKWRRIYFSHGEQHRAAHDTRYGSGVAFEMETLVTDREVMGDFVTSLVNRTKLSIEDILDLRSATSVDDLINIIHNTDVEIELRFL